MSIKIVIIFTLNCEAGKQDLICEYCIEKNTIYKKINKSNLYKVIFERYKCLPCRQ